MADAQTPSRADCSGCGDIFPNKDHGGLCGRCSRLDENEGDPDEQARIKTIPQCRDCGAIGRFFVDSQCGTCRRQAEGNAELLDKVTADALAARKQVFQGRMQDGKARGKVRNGLVNVPNSPSVDLTSGNLNALRHPSGRMITVCVVPYIDTKESMNLGSINRAYSAETPMADIVDTVLQGWNQQWEHYTSCSLQASDITVLWYNKINPEPNTLDGSLGNFYDIHRSVPNADAYLGAAPPSYKSLKGPKYERRTHVEAPPEITQKRAGAKRTHGSIDVETGPSKRARNSAIPPLVSLFIPSAVAPQADPTSAITLKRAVTTVNEETGEVRTKWGSGHREDLLQGQIASNPLAHGKTKKVYALTIGEKDFVAKRFFEVGHGPTKVSIKENSELLVKELTRLKNLKWFLDAFYAEAEERGIEVARDFACSEGFLAVEVIGVGAEPSDASGVSKEDYMAALSDLENDPMVVWLIEPRRALRVEHYTGTMEFPNRPGKVGATISAFTHFVYHASNEQLLFADLQSSQGVVEDAAGKNSVKRVLFDVMTHSVDQDSGIGDHGQAGFSKFLQGHICNAMCKKLGLEEAKEMGESETEGVGYK
ncbi:kinase-like protein [Gloeophyllum trabeum ATCC 11539]|uniref:Kinase-like protein n=1 Tax=Gloeophyllum trabeum (strain ATCC 11539 / FP-39264 / Madison 617) TaxID=670483 RepID=S7QA65_GLOTA|nr:kinase-like protein [Gloeophyllum trabeum ATCC 11539]EPQ56806.1 kinase-like protein [Gloeophyllum trabeum ATCC 11539]